MQFKAGGSLLWRIALSDSCDSVAGEIFIRYAGEQFPLFVWQGGHISRKRCLFVDVLRGYGDGRTEHVTDGHLRSIGKDRRQDHTEEKDRKQRNNIDDTGVFGL